MKLSPGDLALMVGLGATGLLSFALGLIPPPTLACFVPVLGALVSMAMVMWKGRRPGMSAWGTAASTVLLTLAFWNDVVQEDLTAVPAAIARLEEQQAAESDPQLRQEIEQTLAAYRRQQE